MEEYKHFTKVFPNDYKRALEANPSKSNVEHLPPSHSEIDSKDKLEDSKDSKTLNDSEDSPPASPPRKRERTASSPSQEVRGVHAFLFDVVSN